MSDTTEPKTEKKKRGRKPKASGAVGAKDHLTRLTPNQIAKGGGISLGNVRRIAQNFLWDRHRLVGVLKHFHERAMVDNRVLIEYMHYVLPGFKQGEGGSGVTVVINAPTFNEPKTYGPDGEVIETTAKEVEE